MLSRVAQTIHWMQRYRERAENTARFVNVNLLLSMDLPYYQEKQWDPMVKTTGDEEAFAGRYGKATEMNVIEFLTFDEENPNSIFQCLQQARENARVVRETITTEMWQEINTLYMFVQRTAQDRGRFRAPDSFYTRIIRQCQLLTGIADTTMSHSEAWHFGRVGYLLERTDMVSRMLDVKYFMLLPTPEHIGTPYDNIQWSALLRSASAYEMYRKRWRQVHYLPVVEFLVLDRDFPRAIYSCLARAEQSLHAISGAPLDRPGNRPERQLRQLLDELSGMDAKAVIGRGVHEFVDSLQLRLLEISKSIDDAFFALHPVDAANFRTDTGGEA